MKSALIITSTIIVFLSNLLAQNPPPQVFPCIELTPQLLNNYSGTISGYGCYEIEGQTSDVVNIGDDQVVTIEATQEIILKSNTKLGSFGKDGSFHGVIDKGGLEIAWFEPTQTPNIVEKFNKLELGIKLPSDISIQINDFLNSGGELGINPFDPSKIDLYIEFIAPSGKKTLRHAFYYEPYVQSQTDDSWQFDLNNSAFNWRVRLSPDEIGNWQARIYLVNTITEVSPVFATFQCIQSDRNGFLAVGNDRHLYFPDNNKSFIGNGINIAVVDPYVFYQQGSDPHGITPSSLQTYTDALNKIITAEATLTRISIYPTNGLPDWPVYNNYKGKMDEMYAFDKLIELCENNNLYAIFFRWHTELADNEFDFGKPKYDRISWWDNPYKLALNLSEVQSYFTNEEAIKWQKYCLRYINARYGYSPSFTFYGYSEVDYWLELPSRSGEISDEGKYEHKHLKKNVEIMSEWFGEQKYYFQHVLKNDRLMFANTYATFPLFEKLSTFNSNVFMVEQSDIVGIHEYGATKDINFNKRYDKLNKLQKRFDKPIIAEEIGVSHNDLLGIYDCTGIEFHNALWATMMSGSFGTGLDWWWNLGLIEHSYIDDLKYINFYFNGENLHSESFSPQNWKDAIFIKNAKIENFAIKNQSDTKVYGWVHNATFYWRNLWNRNECIQNQVNNSPDFQKKSFEDNYTSTGSINLGPTQFKVTGLKKNIGFKKHWYKIEFYPTQFSNGTQPYGPVSYATKTLSASLGRIKPNTPYLDDKNPDYSYKVSYLGKFRNQPSGMILQPNSDKNTDKKSNYVSEEYLDIEKEKNSLEKKEIENATVKIFPNPSTGKVTIMSSSPMIKIEIMHLGGAIALSKMVSERQITQDISMLESGIYFVKVFFEDSLVVKKLIVN